jgi:hypothetical protein
VNLAWQEVRTESRTPGQKSGRLGRTYGIRHEYQGQAPARRLSYGTTTRHEDLKQYRYTHTSLISA